MSDAITISESALCDMIADSPAFRALVGAETYDVARSHVYVDVLPPPEGNGAAYTEREWKRLLPFVLVSTSDEGFVVSVDSGGTGIDSGKLQFTIERAVPIDESNDNARDQNWKAIVGEIIRDLVAMSGRNDVRPYLSITRITLSKRGRTKYQEVAAEAGENQFADVVVEWGAAQ